MNLFHLYMCSEQSCLLDNLVPDNFTGYAIPVKTTWFDFGQDCSKIEETFYFELPISQKITTSANQLIYQQYLFFYLSRQLLQKTWLWASQRVFNVFRIPLNHDVSFTQFITPCSTKPYIFHIELNWWYLMKPYLTYNRKFLGLNDLASQII